jgi:hypothetical protein
MSGIMKEFGNANGVIYVDKPEDALWKAVVLIENGSIEEEGKKRGSLLSSLAGIISQMSLSGF